MTFRLGLVCNLGVGPDRGGRSENEDNYLSCEDGLIRYLDGDEEQIVHQPGEGRLLAVCDGMGGHEHGQLASTTAVRVLAKLFGTRPKDPAQALRRYVLRAHETLHARARAEGPVQMGTTLIACWILDYCVSWVHIGDSRLYIHRGGQLIPLTVDHTRNEFLRRDGLPLRKDGDRLCQTFIFGSRGLGDNASLRIEPGLDTGSELLLTDDLLLLCTDGVTGAVPDEVLGELLAAHDDPQQAADAILAAAVARGATDNITALVVRVIDSPHSTNPFTDTSEPTFTF